MSSHELKVWPDWFADLMGGKTFELRKDDRAFKVGDRLVLREYAPGPDVYTGRQIEALVIYRLGSEDIPFGSAGLQKGYCILGLGQMRRCDDRRQDG